MPARSGRGRSAENDREEAGDASEQEDIVCFIVNEWIWLLNVAKSMGLPSWIARVGWREEAAWTAAKHEQRAAKRKGGLYDRHLHTCCFCDLHPLLLSGRSRA